jgi:hypothetical protein
VSKASGGRPMASGGRKPTEQPGERRTDRGSYPVLGTQYFVLSTQYLAALTILFVALAIPAAAQTPVNAPVYAESYLTSLFPAGGQRGQTLTIELSGSNYGYFPGAKDILIDGPPGITVKDLKLKANDRALDATFVIAPDAPLGRRSVRVLNERTGLTNMLFFHVGRLPEALEAEPNNDLG